MGVSDADLRDWKQGLDERESDSMDVHEVKGKYKHKHKESIKIWLKNRRKIKLLERGRTLTNLSTVECHYNSHMGIRTIDFRPHVIVTRQYVSPGESVFSETFNHELRPRPVAISCMSLADQVFMCRRVISVRELFFGVYLAWTFKQSVHQYGKYAAHIGP